MRKIMLCAVAPLASLGLVACDVEQTEEGSMPDVDVNVEEGNLPEYEVDAPEIKVGTTETTVDVPVVAVEPGDVDSEEPDENQ